jgi:hypothetical protein
MFSALCSSPFQEPQHEAHYQNKPLKRNENCPHRLEGQLPQPKGPPPEKRSNCGATEMAAGTSIKSIYWSQCHNSLHGFHEYFFSEDVQEFCVLPLPPHVSS